ncbi:hypothetical protein [Bacillus pseudomycoides]|uniref:hypothetical protein n=1 Tax=Bacillus pseudomycoides TaxID=64104 RepID=UPI000BFE2B55|nr:hypothetical protein [Bacillus pseudomycoides]PHE46924.1 hypothetical protein COF53_14865 [Bacillus pseudomycoides]
MKKRYSMYKNLISALKELRMDVFSSELLKSAFKLTIFVLPFAALMYCLVYIIMGFSNVNQVINFSSILGVIILCIFISILLFLAAFGFCSRLILLLSHLRQVNQHVKVHEDKPVVYREKQQN